MSGVENCGQAICGSNHAAVFSQSAHTYDIFRILFDIAWIYCIVHTDLEPQLSHTICSTLMQVVVYREP